MPTPRSLNPFEARASLANRLGTRVADRLRQFSTKFGLRPYRVFLVWTTFDGEERGEGRERELQRIEVLPTPRISELTALQAAAYPTGVIGTGAIRADLISVKFTESQLNGTAIPARGQALGDYPDKIDFWWEMRADGRGLDVAKPIRFRLAAAPMLLPGSLGWAVMLEKQEEATNATDYLPPFADR